MSAVLYVSLRLNPGTSILNLPELLQSERAHVVRRFKANAIASYQRKQQPYVLLSTLHILFSKRAKQLIQRFRKLPKGKIIDQLY